MLALVQFAMINFAVFIIILILSYQTKLYSDDLSMLYDTGGVGNTILEKAFKYAVKYHLTWGGRSIAAFLRVIFALNNKLIYDVINSLVFVTMCNIIYMFTFPEKNNKEKHPELLLFISCILWFTIPTFGQIVLWLTGSIAYMWFGCVQIFYVFLLYKRFRYEYIDKKPIITIIIYSVGMLFVGFISGCASEPSSCMMVVTCFAWSIYMIKSKKHVYVYEWFGVLGVIFGFVFLFTAPGIYARGNTVVQHGNEIVIIISNFIRQTYYAGKYLLIPLLFAIVPTFIDEKRVSLKEYVYNEKEQIILIFMAFFNIYIMIFSPGSAVRIYFTSVILIIAASGISFRKYFEGRFILAKKAFVIFLALITVLSILTAMIQCHKSGKPLEMQMDYCAENIGELL